MSTHIPGTWYAIIGAALLFAVLLAGCTGSPSGPVPVTTQATPETTSPPATPAATTVVTTATIAGTTTAATPLATTTPVMTITEAPTTPSSPPGVAVTIQNFAFSPPSVTVPKRTTVTWTNQDPAPHTIVNDATSTIALGKLFSSNSLGTGQTFSFTFNDPGIYAYHCGIHTSMHGTVTVT
jgi:plastocyanin